MELGEAFGLVVGVLAFAILLATVNERLIESFVAPLLEASGVPALKGMVGQVAVITGTVISILFGVDLFTPVAEAIGMQLTAPWAGLLLSGLLVGGGSNFIHDIWPTSEPDPEINVWPSVDD